MPPHLLFYQAHARLPGSQGALYGRPVVSFSLDALVCWLALAGLDGEAVPTVSHKTQTKTSPTQTIQIHSTTTKKNTRKENTIKSINQNTNTHGCYYGIVQTADSSHKTSRSGPQRTRSTALSNIERTSYDRQSPVIMSRSIETPPPAGADKSPGSGISPMTQVSPKTDQASASTPNILSSANLGYFVPAGDSIERRRSDTRTEASEITEATSSSSASVAVSSPLLAAARAQTQTQLSPGPSPGASPGLAPVPPPGPSPRTISQCPGHIQFSDSADRRPSSVLDLSSDAMYGNTLRKMSTASVSFRAPSHNLPQGQPKQERRKSPAPTRYALSLVISAYGFVSSCSLPLFLLSYHPAVPTCSPPSRTSSSPCLPNLLDQGCKQNCGGIASLSASMDTYRYHISLALNQSSA